MQIWLNLINNSINEAIKKGIKNPKITIKISNDKVEFIDNLGGFDKEISQEIKNSNYRGLGLKMCSDICAKYNKKFVIQNGENGALFVIIPIPTNNSIS